MIAKITKGRRAGGALRYDFGPGHREEHKDPRIIAGNVPGTHQQVARIIDRHVRQRPDATRPIWRCSLSLPDEDGVLTDQQWAVIAEQYVGRMWGPDVPWTAVRHGDDHIHLTVARVRWNGELASDAFDYRRSRPIVRALEREHGLINADERSNRTAPQVSGQEKAAAARRGASSPEREQLRALVRSARDRAAGRGPQEFEAQLSAAGVEFRANVASNGRMNGYAFHLPGWTDAAGEKIWLSASRVSRDLRWNDLSACIGTGEPDPRATWALPAQPHRAEAPAQEAPKPAPDAEAAEAIRLAGIGAARPRPRPQKRQPPGAQPSHPRQTGQDRGGLGR